MARVVCFSGVHRVSTGEFSPHSKFILLSGQVTEGLPFLYACSCENAQHHSLFQAPRQGYFSLGWSSSGEHVLITLKVFTVRRLCSLHLIWTWHVLPSFSGLAPTSVLADPGVLSLKDASGGGRSPFRMSFEITPLFWPLHLCVGLHLSF